MTVLLRVHCTLALCLYNKPDIPEMSAQCSQRMTGEHWCLSLPIFQVLMLHQLSGVKVIYSDVPKKTAVEVGREKHEFHLLEKCTLLGIICKRVLGLILFHYKVDFYYPKTIL